MLIVIFLHPVSLYRLCIQTDIQHRVHHARHACPPAGPHCNQKWVLRVSKFAAGSRPQVRCSTKQTIDTGTSRCQAQENYNAETCHSLISSWSGCQGKKWWAKEWCPNFPRATLRSAAISAPALWGLLDMTPSPQSESTPAHSSTQFDTVAQAAKGPAWGNFLKVAGVVSDGQWLRIFPRKVPDASRNAPQWSKWILVAPEVQSKPSRPSWHLCFPAILLAFLGVPHALLLHLHRWKRKLQGSCGLRVAWCNTICPHNLCPGVIGMEIYMSKLETQSDQTHGNFSIDQLRKPRLRDCHMVWSTFLHTGFAEQ